VSAALDPVRLSMPAPPSAVTAVVLADALSVSLPLPPSNRMVPAASEVPARLPIVKLSSPSSPFTSMPSTFVMPTLKGTRFVRLNRAVLPLAESVKVSPAVVEPFTSWTSMPSPPSNVSVLSPLFQMLRSLPRRR
jgi:hypothetical protein